MGERERCSGKSPSAGPLLTELQPWATLLQNPLVGGTSHKSDLVLTKEAVPASPDPPFQSSSRTVAFPMMLSRHFVGRQDALDHVAQLLRGIPIDHPKEVAIFGMPGIGKTQLALGYAQLHTVNNGAGVRYRQQIFLRAKDKAQVQSEVRRVLLGLGLSKDAVVNSMGYSLMVEKLKSFLRATDGWLLIFDNVSDNNDLLEVRPQDGRGHVLYTTRNKNTAELVCGADNIVELDIMSQNDGATLIKSWMGAALSRTPEAEIQALHVADFAKGLPLAIEQVAHFARSENVTLDRALGTMRRKEQLLRQKRIDCFHEDNFTVGAILIATFEALKRRLAMAGALFQVLSYLEVSSISISMLQEGAHEMETHLARKGTYNRGTVRTRQGQAHHHQQIERQKFDLFDYDGPFDVRLYNRLLRRGEFAKYRQPRLRRVDSESDIEMQWYWQSDSKLQRVFDNQNQLILTINEIQSSGLVRKVENDALWMHDLFAELMTAYTAAMESKAQSEAKVQTAATLVWLAFPTTQKQLVAWRKSFEYLPHAQSCLRHLREHGTLLMDANVGAELNHVVASTFCWRMGNSVDGAKAGHGSADERRKADWEMALQYYKDALTGYIAAHKRLMAMPGMCGWKGMRKISKATEVELQEEIECQGKGKGAIRYHPTRWMHQTERFGSNALWRALQTLGRLADVLERLERNDEALSHLKKAEKLAEILWQSSKLGGEEVERISIWVAYLLKKKGDWETALGLAKEALQLTDQNLSLQVAGQALHIGQILFELQKGDEGIQWLESAMWKAQGFYGKYHFDCWGFYTALIKGYGELCDCEAILRCWLDALGTILLSNDGDQASEDRLSRMEDFVNGFKNARAKCESNGVRIEELGEQLVVAERAVDFYKGTVLVGRQFRALKNEEVDWEITEEMKEWYNIGKEREWI